MTPDKSPAAGPAVPQDAPAPKKRGNPFKAGHPRYGGRKKGSPIKRTAEAREIAESMGFHPVEFLAGIAQTGMMPNPDGSKTKCSTAERLDAAKAVSQYLVPKLAATQVTGKDDGPVMTANYDLGKLMSDPGAVEAAQKLALMISEAPETDSETPADGDGQ